MDSSANLLIVCHILVEHMDKEQQTTKSERIRNGNLSLWRNEFREIVLTVSKSEKSSPVKYVLHDVKIHSKFMKEGKSTLILVNHNVRLLLSNCPPANLKKFFRILSVKLATFKKGDKISSRKKLLAGMPKSFEEISPLSEKDLNTVNMMRQGQKIVANSDVGNTASNKRKQPFSDRTNNQLSTEPPVKKRMLILPCDNLSNEQKHILNVIKRGRNIFFTGSAGTGKSFLLRHVVGILPPSHTFVTASTGVAACHIGGMTLHSFVGFKEAGSFEQTIQSVRSRKGVVRQWKACKHLIIDEISMIGAEFFDCIEAVARAIRGTDEPFGGIQLIICGDFFQLPPVSRGKEKKKFCFQSKSWSKCIDHSWELQKIYRQTDFKFIRVLQNIRLGRCSSSDTEILKATQANKTEQNGILATKLCTHIENVKQTNQYHLDKLSGEVVMYPAQDNSEAYSSILDKLLPDTQSVELKIGAQVMLTKNLDVGNGLVNGARGVVVSFNNDQKRLPVVRFLSGRTQVVKFENWPMKISSDIIAFRKQLPLKLAWAISIHKSQGMSLDCVEMSLSRVFERGQAYVALSRATSLQGLRVLDFDSSCVRSNVDVLRFYRQLRNMQKQEDEMMQPLRKQFV